MRGERAAGTPTPGWFQAHARPDAGRFTRSVNYPVAARWCVYAYRVRLRPTGLTLANLLLGSVGSIMVIAFASAVPASRVPGAAVGAVAWLAWQAAYCCDCADGQLARVTGTSSAAGGRLDVLCDIGVQVLLITATAVIADAARPGIPVWLPVAFAGTWMVNLVTSVMARQGTNTSLLTSTAWPVQVLKLTRDYGFAVTLIAAVIAFVPEHMMWLMAGFTVINGGFLTGSIIQSTRAAVTSGEAG